MRKYNETTDLIEQYESENKIVVLRPSKLIKMQRVEKDTDKLQAIHNLGVSDCMKKLDKIKEYSKNANIMNSFLTIWNGVAFLEYQLVQWLNEVYL